MAHGGIYDQVGGGFARYSVDEVWLVPHFEKMLYDNALLARAYLHGLAGAGARALAPGLHRHARLGAPRDAGAGGRLLLGPRRRLRGRGGTLLLWTQDEIRDALGAADLGSRSSRSGVAAASPGGQLRGAKHPPRPGRPGASGPSVWTPRSTPSTSAAPNGSGRVSTTSALLLERPDDRGARRGGRRVGARRPPGRRPALRGVRLDRDAQRRGRLRRSWKDGEARLDAYLEDYAYLVEALLTLYEATFEPRWFDAARADRRPDDRAVRRSRAGGFFTTHDHELIARRKDMEDHPIPSGCFACKYEFDAAGPRLGTSYPCRKILLSRC